MNEFVEVVRQEDSTLYTAFHEDLHVEEAYGLTRPEACRTINAGLGDALHALTYVQWMHWLFELNRLRRDRYRYAYHKGTLRNICKVLHWFLQQDARHPDVWIITSLHFRQCFREGNLDRPPAYIWTPPGLQGEKH